MLDLRLIREQPDLVRDALQKRQMETASVAHILSLDEERRAKTSELENLRAQRNAISKEIGRMKDEAGREEKKEQVRGINTRIDALEGLVNELDAQLQGALSEVPNIPDPDVPLGKDDSENVVIKKVGTPREFD